jgi:hypothetical protein
MLFAVDFYMLLRRFRTMLLRIHIRNALLIPDPIDRRGIQKVAHQKKTISLDYPNHPSFVVYYHIIQHSILRHCKLYLGVMFVIG